MIPTITTPRPCRDIPTDLLRQQLASLNRRPLTAIRAEERAAIVRELAERTRD